MTESLRGLDWQVWGETREMETNKQTELRIKETERQMIVAASTANKLQSLL